MKYNSMKRAAEAVHKRIQGLELEEKMIRDSVDDQVGTSIPRSFTAGKDNFIIDPSNVGTGILDRMIKTDDTISAAVQFKILMILSKVGDYHHDDDKIKEFVKEFLQGMKSPTWGAAMEAMLSYHGYKFSVSEIVFGLDTNLNKVPRKIVTYHPSTVAFEVDENGEITENGILQFTNQHSRFSNPNFTFSAVRHGFKVVNPFSTPIDRLQPFRVPFFTQIGMVRIPRNKVLHFTGMNFNAFGNPYGNSAVRTNHLLWSLKNFILKQLGISSKQGAMGKIHATAPFGEQKVEVVKGDGTKEIVSPSEAVRLMLSDIQNQDSFVTGPESEGYKMTVLDNSADLNQYTETINQINIWMFRSFLLPSLVLTDGSSGSRSLGDKHFQLVDKIADSESEFFTQIVVNEMIERVIIENFGVQKNYGKFNRRPQTVEERQALASMFGGLANDGWMKPHVKEDFEFVRENLHLPKDADKTFDLTEKGEPKLDENGEPIDNGSEIPGESKEVSPGGQIAGVSDDHSSTAFNGAQVTSLLDLVKQVSLNEIPADAAIEILISAFQMDPVVAKRIINSAQKFVPQSQKDEPSNEPVSKTKTEEVDKDPPKVDKDKTEEA